MMPKTDPHHLPCVGGCHKASELKLEKKGKNCRDGGHNVSAAGLAARRNGFIPSVSQFHNAPSVASFLLARMAALPYCCCQTACHVLLLLIHHTDHALFYFHHTLPGLAYVPAPISLTRVFSLLLVIFTGP